MNEDWYEYRSSGEEDWYAPAQKVSVPESLPVPKKKKKRTGLIIGLIVIGVFVLIAASCLLLQRFFPELFGKNAYLYDGYDDFGGNGNYGEEHEMPDFSEDFRDFFNNYYVASNEVEPCTIPQVKAFSPLRIELHEQGSTLLSYQDIYAKCVPSIVGISAYVDEKSDDYFYWGSGIILSEDGYIVTNSHIIEGSCRATVTLFDETEYSALLVGYDPRSDIAVLKIDAHGLTPAEFCSGEQAQVGDQIVALGNPLGSEFRSSMTEGIISGIDRDIPYNDTTLTLVQISAPINGGSSGGALLNMYGQVLGITNMKMSATYSGATSIEGLGFAIPSKTVKSMADSLLASGEVKGRPALGLTVGGIPDAAKEQYGLPGGLYVSAVSEYSDCAAKGILVGDVILSVNGAAYEDSSELTTYLADLSVGDTLTLEVWRMDENGNSQTFTVVVSLFDRNEVY